jgi:hypothetical protein
MPKRDMKLVELLIEHLNSRRGTDYKVTSRPDQKDGTNKAVEAIATAGDGTSIAIEHTLIEPFFGDKDDTQPLLKVFARVETDPECCLREYYIEVYVPVGAIRKGNWAQLADEFKVWLRSTKEVLPEGESYHAFSKLQPDLKISISKTHLPGVPGKVTVGRSDMPEDFPKVIRTALAKKLSKLSTAVASKRVLLLEKDSPTYSYRKIANEIEQACGEFPEMKQINEIWLVDTVAWETEGQIAFDAHLAGSLAKRGFFRERRGTSLRKSTKLNTPV